MKWTFKKAISIFRYLIQPLGMINAPVDLTQSEIITAYAVLCLQMFTYTGFGSGISHKAVGTPRYLSGFILVQL